MANLDTRNKRASSIGINAIYCRLFPEPGSTIDSGYRAQIALCYSGSSFSLPLNSTDTHDGFNSNVGGPLFPEHFFEKKSPKKLKAKFAKIHKEVPNKEELPQKINELELKVRVEGDLLSALSQSNIIGEKAVKEHLALLKTKEKELKVLEEEVEFYKAYRAQLLGEDDIMLNIIKEWYGRG